MPKQSLLGTRSVRLAQRGDRNRREGPSSLRPRSQRLLSPGGHFARVGARTSTGGQLDEGQAVLPKVQLQDRIVRLRGGNQVPVWGVRVAPSTCDLQ